MCVRVYVCIYVHNESDRCDIAGEIYSWLVVKLDIAEQYLVLYQSKLVMVLCYIFQTT